MRRKRLLIVAVLVSLTCFVAIYARPIPVRSNRTIEVTARVSTPADLAAYNKALADPEVMRRSEAAMLANSVPKKMEISTDDGGVVEVAIGTSLLERRAGYRYRWTLNVFDKDWKTRFVNRRYDEQIFTVPDQRLEPTFAERFVLRPGSYNVEVVLHAIPPTLDPADLADEAIDRAHRVVSSNKPVVVLP